MLTKKTAPDKNTVASLAGTAAAFNRVLLEHVDASGGAMLGQFRFQWLNVLFGCHETMVSDPCFRPMCFI